MPSRNSSKTASRRNEPLWAFPPFLILVLLAALAAAPAWAQSMDLGVRVRPDGIHASLWFRWNKEQELVSSLRNGMEARIVFTLRVYRRRGGLLPFLADKLLTETSVARSAFWDFLDRKFVVESDDGSRAAYTNAPDLLVGFLSLADLKVFRFSPPEGDRLYVSARARLEPVRLMPPLTIVTLVGAAASYTTPWERREAQ
jgi:hypothetical protein